MREVLLRTLIGTKNEAADDVLLEALRIGGEEEQGMALTALLERKTVRGLGGVVGMYDSLPAGIQARILENIRAFHAALRECGRSEDTELVSAAMKLIALGRQGRLTYVLSEALHSTDEALARGAVEAIVGLARWVATESRNLQRLPEAERAAIYHQLMDERGEIEAAVARAIDVHRGRHGAELLRAALLLADWPGSRTLAILHTAKHGGQSPMVRRLQQPPDSEHVEAFLLGASHGALRSHFGIAFSHVDQAPVLDAILRKTHWLKDQQLQLCMHQISRGVWWGEAELERDLLRRDPADGAKIAEWLAFSGSHDAVQDDRMEPIRNHAAKNFEGRLRLMRIAMRRPKGGSVKLLRTFLSDPDERLMRIAAREVVRRRPVEFENMLLQLMTNAPESVRRVIARSVGQVGFEQFWQRFDRLDKETRKSAGRAMLKILPDAIQRLARRIGTGPVEQRIKGIAVVQELGIADSVASLLIDACGDPNPKVRSKAVAAMGEMKTPPPDVLLDRLLHDGDGRVRANAIEVLESKRRDDYVPLLAQRARSMHNRERANAVKALCEMKVGEASTHLLAMLRDDIPEHRISALWVLRQVGWWQLVSEIGRLAKADGNLRVRRYAFGILRGLADALEEKKAQ